MEAQTWARAWSLIAQKVGPAADSCLMRPGPWPVGFPDPTWRQSRHSRKCVHQWQQWVEHLPDPLTGPQFRRATTQHLL